MLNNLSVMILYFCDFCAINNIRKKNIIIKLNISKLPSILLIIKLSLNIPLVSLELLPWTLEQTAVVGAWLIGLNNGGDQLSPATTRKGRGGNTQYTKYNFSSRVGMASPGKLCPSSHLTLLWWAARCLRVWLKSFPPVLRVEINIWRCLKSSGGSWWGETLDHPDQWESN